MPFYDNYSAGQPTALGVNLASRESLNHLKKILKVEKKIHSVLELGPGRGIFARHCIERGFNYTCADVSWPLLTVLPVKKKVLTLAPSLPFVDDNFDVAFAANLLEHMPDFHSALLLVEEMRRVTHIGGLVCQRVPNAMAWGFHFWNGDYTHSFFTSPRTVSQVYLDAGLRIEAIHPVAGFVVGPIARIVSILSKLIPSWMIDHGANPTSRLTKSIYSVKTTFLLGFLIIGRKI